MAVFCLWCIWPLSDNARIQRIFFFGGGVSFVQLYLCCIVSCGKVAFFPNALHALSLTVTPPLVSVTAVNSVFCVQYLCALKNIYFMDTTILILNVYFLSG